MSKSQITTRFCSALMVLFIAACTSTGGLDMDALNAAEINNFRAPDSSLLSSGQPTQAQFQIIARAGVRHVINLRTPSEEVDFAEQAAVEALGMEYYSIPVAGGGGINSANAASLASILEGLDGEPALVHCASGNRVGGLFAVNAFAGGSSLDAAISEGARWGMTSERLQQTVRQNLSGN